MPISFHVDGPDLVCEGDGMPFLRLKTRLAGFLGPGQLRSSGQNTFRLPAELAAAAAPIFTESCGSVPTLLTDQVTLQAAHAAARAEAMRIALENEISPLAPPWPDILDPPQAVAVSAMTVPGLLGLCLFDEQGIGKTVMALAAFDTLRTRGDIGPCVIVCPKTMLAAWPKDIDRFLPSKYKVVLASGPAETKNRAVLSGFDILILNFESVASLIVPLRAVLTGKKPLLVVDESFNVKNKDAARSEAVRELRRFCNKGFVLCGTPAPNSPSDVIHQFDVADGGYTFAGFVKPADDANLATSIAARIDERGSYIRRLKEEVLPQLPAKRFHIIPVSLAGRQAAMYEEARSRLELRLRSMDNVTFKRSLTTYFQQRAALLQICACPEAIDPTFADASAKMLALDALVEKLAGQQRKKLIIWSFYRASLRAAFERYAAFSPVLLDGSTEAKDRAQAVSRFQSDPQVRLCIANPAAAGAGITLHSAAEAAYLSFSNQAAHFLQSIDRTHRRGQTAPQVNYHLLVCRGTIEESEVRRLRAKEVRQHRLFEDRVTWPNSLDEALSELSVAHEQ